MRWALLVGLVTTSARVDAAYSNLVAAEDGSAVYFEVRTSVPDNAWYRLRRSDGKSVVERVSSVADVAGRGNIIAYAGYASRYCGILGSTCLLQAQCSASFSISGPQGSVSGIRRRTFLRLDRSGSVAWLEQDQGCPVLNAPFPAPLNGLYDARELRPIAAANGARLASRRYGRRAITGSGKALTFTGQQLQWLDAAGARPIFHRNGAFEAVTDDSGASVVYVEQEVGRLHWLYEGEDYELGVVGSAPALSGDGNEVFFLGVNGELVRYDGRTGETGVLGEGLYLEFTLAADAVFAVTVENRVVRIDRATGHQVELLDSFPEIAAFDPPLRPSMQLCPLFCYHQFAPYGIEVRSGARVTISGRFLDRRGWRVASAAYDVDVEPASFREAWFEVPATPRLAAEIVEIYHPEHPLRFRLAVQQR
ncbi:MAG: hypothetical protein JNL62_19240 [Bryobacterales bacterium]|nr:hypothetical protein [Bryobacterales bacterium]